MFNLTVYGNQTPSKVNLSQHSTIKELKRIVKEKSPFYMYHAWLVSQKRRLITLLDLDDSKNQSIVLEDACRHSKTIVDVSYRYTTEVWTVPFNLSLKARELYKLHTEIIHTHITGTQLHQKSALQKLRRIEQRGWESLRSELVKVYNNPKYDTNDEKSIKGVIKKVKKQIKIENKKDLKLLKVQTKDLVKKTDTTPKKQPKISKKNLKNASKNKVAKVVGKAVDCIVDDVNVIVSNVVSNVVSVTETALQKVETQIELAF